jgi:endoglucanase
VTTAAALALALQLCAGRSPWPLWNAYVDRFISKDGRVIDHGAGAITTSEGQSYALFFALVANDRPLFSRLLAWTSDNLAEGCLGERLPAYKWGRRPDGGWGVLDTNSAADSDLWLAYVLVQAGRLWRDPALDHLGRTLAREVIAREVADLPGLGPMLLPAPQGFVHGKLWRLNPSYVPFQLLRGFESAGVPGPWQKIRASTLRMLAARATHGFVDDWVAYRPRRGFVTDPEFGAIGSYDAIRTYLWAGLLHESDPDRRRLAAWLSGPLAYWRKHGRVPERVDTARPAIDAPSGPVGFLAVLWPRVRGSGDALALEKQIEAERHGSLYGDPPSYYDQNLLLFAQGFVSDRYRFARDGRLSLARSGCR